MHSPCKRVLPLSRGFQTSTYAILGVPLQTSVRVLRRVLGWLFATFALSVLMYGHAQV